MTRTVPAAFARRKAIRLGAALTGLLLTAALIATVQVPAYAGTATPIDPSDLISTLNKLSGTGTVAYTLAKADNAVTGNVDLAGQDVVLDLQGGSLTINGEGADTTPTAVTVSGHTLTVVNGSLTINGADGKPGAGTADPGGSGQGGLNIDGPGRVRAETLTVTGGAGGNGGAGGDGGAGGYGVHMSGILSVTDATITGGAGGNGGNGSPDGSVAGGAGGLGGAGVVTDGPNSLFLGAGSKITGGHGGNGGDGSVSDDGNAGAGGASSTGSVIVPGTGGKAGDPGQGTPTGTLATDGGTTTVTPNARFFSTASAESPAEIDLYAPGVTAAKVSDFALDLPPAWPSRNGYTLSGWADSSTSTTDVSSQNVTDRGAYYTLWASLLTPGQPAAQAPFLDVPLGAPFEPDIAWLKDQKITGGFADGSFRPTTPITREAVAAFLYRQAHDGLDAPAPAAAPFPDVPATARFAGDIAWLKDQRVTTGYADGHFHPAGKITRAAAAAFLYRTAHDGAGAEAPIAQPFTDVPTSSPFAGDIAWLKTQHITTGYPDGTYRPGTHITREAVAAFLHRAATN